MSKARTSSSESRSWLDSSQVFADTQRVDLFNDPPWEAAPDPSPHRATTATRDGSRWTAARSAVASKLAIKRGQHSPKS